MVPNDPNAVPEALKASIAARKAFHPVRTLARDVEAH